jgi:acetyl esterase/lipase
MMSKQQRDSVNALMAEAPVEVAGAAAEQRPVFEAMMTAGPLAPDVRLTPGELGGVPILSIEIEGTEPAGVALWLHGGWYALGSPRTAAGLAADLARRAGVRVVSVDYRLAPEHPFPAAFEDVRIAYDALLAEGTRPEQVVLVGESAGGGLVAATLASLPDAGLPQPAAAVLFSPWTDLTLSGESMRTKADSDPAFDPRDVAVRVADYVGAADPADPRVSPHFADLRGVAPLLIQVGAREILLDDAIRLAAHAANADVSVTLEVTPDVPHVFQAFAAILDEGDAALDSASLFIARHLGR